MLRKKVTNQTKLLLIVGFLLVIIPIFFYINEGVQLAFFTPKVVAVKNSYPLPTRITIPSVNVELPLAETTISHGIWEIAPGAISHLTISARPGEQGVIVLYGHNTNDRFGPIRWTNVGQTVLITTQDGRIHKYVIKKTEDVSSNQVSILTSQKGQTLILYTCDGFADLQRFIVVAKPV